MGDNNLYVDELFGFIEASPTPFHAVDTMKRMLDEEGYEQLLEGSEWKIKEQGKYYVIRNGSSMIAFRIPMMNAVGFQIMASHSDAPCLKIKENPEIETEKQYVKLNVEKYGGLSCGSWFDRPLSVAGRLIVDEDGSIKTRLLSVDKDLLMIPSLAIHMNRDMNEGYRYSIQKDLLPLYGDFQATGGFMEQIAKEAGIEKEAILGSDLYLYNRMKGTRWGATGEYISIGRLDDLQCAFASIRAFLMAGESKNIPMHCVFDNEEVGSSTKQGAASTFLKDTLKRITKAMGGDRTRYCKMLANSFMLSADNAHAVHPNYPEKACPTNRPYPNLGVVVKHSANQKYTTDGVSAALFRKICEWAKVPCQNYVNHADIPGGSTLGNISGNQVAVKCVDIGLAQLAMHSAYETGGVKDTEYLIRAAKVFYEVSVCETACGEWKIEL